MTRWVNEMIQQMLYKTAVSVHWEVTVWDWAIYSRRRKIKV